jgi:hypothetical protein
MGARHKLNSIYGLGVLIAASLIGGLAESWGVFTVVLTVLSAAAYHNGSIRPRADLSARPAWENCRAGRGRNMCLLKPLF